MSSLFLGTRSAPVLLVTVIACACGDGAVGGDAATTSDLSDRFDEGGGDAAVDPTDGPGPPDFTIAPPSVGACARTALGSLQVMSATGIPGNDYVVGSSTFGFVLVRAIGTTQIEAYFTDSPVPAEATVPANWTLSPSLAISAVSLVGTKATLTTAAQTPGQSYQLSAPGVHAANDATAAAGAAVSFAGYRFGLSQVTAPNSYAPPKTISVVLTDTVACAALTTAANFQVSGRTVVAAKSPGCATRASFVQLELDQAPTTGTYTLTAGAALTGPAGQAPVPDTLTFDVEAPAVPLYVHAISVAGGQITVDFGNDAPASAAAAAASYQLTPAVSITAVTVSSPTRVVLTAATDPNTVYTLSFPGFSAGAPVPPARLLGAGSFYLRNASVNGLHKASAVFSQALGVGADLVGSYTFSGGPTVMSVDPIGPGAVIAKLNLAGDQAGQRYPLGVAGVSSQAGVPLFAGVASTVEVVLSHDVDPTLGPIAAYLDGVDVISQRGTALGVDAKHLRLVTGPLPAGTHTLTLCGLTDTSGTQRVGMIAVPVTIP